MKNKKLRYRWYKCEPGTMPEDFPEMIEPNEKWRTKPFVVMLKSGFMISNFRYTNVYHNGSPVFHWGARYSGQYIIEYIKYWSPVPPMPEDI